MTPFDITMNSINHLLTDSISESTLSFMRSVTKIVIQKKSSLFLRFVQEQCFLQIILQCSCVFHPITPNVTQRGHFWNNSPMQTLLYYFEDIILGHLQNCKLIGLLAHNTPARLRLISERAPGLYTG